MLNIDINREKVLRLIRILDTNKANGYHRISVTMIKICDMSIVDPLCCIFERCLETGYLPFPIEASKYNPCAKRLQTKQKNYRPISLLPIFGKMFEKILFDVIYEHFNSNGLLSSHQSGFRPGESNINQLLLTMQNIYNAFDGTPSKEARAIFLDLSKALDRVWHEGLI